MPKTSKHQVIVATWNDLIRPSVGTRELRAVLKALKVKFSDTTQTSPATIARVLADAGAALRHPEVIECDAQWRGRCIESQAKKLESLERLVANHPASLEQAEILLAEMESLRSRLAKDSDSETMARLIEIATEIRRKAEGVMQDRTRDAHTRETQKEVSNWIKVWMQTPALLADWIELRRRSPDFRTRFLPEKAEEQ